MSENNGIDLSRLGSSNSNSNNTSQNSATVSGSSDTTGESLPVPAPVAPSQLWLGGQLNGGAVYQPALDLRGTTLPLAAQFGLLSQPQIQAQQVASLTNIPSISSLALGLQQVPQAQPQLPQPTIQTSQLLGQLPTSTLASIASGATTNTAQMPTAVAAGAPSLLSPPLFPQAQGTNLLGLLAAQQQAPIQQQTTSTSASLVQQQPGSQPLVPAAASSNSAAQNQQNQLLQSLIQDNAQKDQIVALLMAQQQQAAVSANNAQIEGLLRSISANNNAAFPSAQLAAQGTLVQGVQLPSTAYPAVLSMGHHTIASLLAAHPALANLKASSQVAAAAAAASESQESLKDQRWNIRFEELMEFKQQHGHCRVPHGYPPNRKLSWWVMNQRAQYQLLKDGKKSWLSTERVKILNDVGFEWNPVSAKSKKKSAKKKKGGNKET